MPPGSCFNIKVVFLCMVISMLKVRRLGDRLVSHTRVYETSAGCLRSIYPSLGRDSFMVTLQWASDVKINRPY